MRNNLCKDGMTAPRKKKRYSGEKSLSGYAKKAQERKGGFEKGEAALERRSSAPDYREEACLEEFRCISCGRKIRPAGAGSKHRNHCPCCLHSRHVDIEPGDRASDCHGDMEPVGIWVKDDGEWAILHRCRKCGVIHSNRVLADDNPLALMQLAVKPLANPPFPLRFLEDCLREEKDE